MIQKKFFLYISLILIFFIFLYYLFEYLNPLNKNSYSHNLISTRFITPVVLPTPTPKFMPEPLEFKKIFQTDHLWTSTLSAGFVNTVLATGDIMIGRSINRDIIKLADFTYPYKGTSVFLSESDIAVINLETPIIENCPIYDHGFVFCADKRHIQGLTFAGIDIVGIANNHTQNFGTEGVKETIKILRENNIQVVGLGDFTIKISKGIRFGFLAYNDIYPIRRDIAWADVETIKQDVQKIKEQCDVVIVLFHWGQEYTTLITERQKELAYTAVDQGADLIIGNHAHWIQPLEFYKGKLIMYAHGNFIFDQYWSKKTMEGVMGKYIFYKDVLIDAEFIPVVIGEYGTPQVAEKDDEERIINELELTSEKLTIEK